MAPRKASGLCDASSHGAEQDLPISGQQVSLFIRSEDPAQARYGDKPRSWVPYLRKPDLLELVSRDPDSVEGQVKGAIGGQSLEALATAGSHSLFRAHLDSAVLACASLVPGDAVIGLNADAIPESYFSVADTIPESKPMFGSHGLFMAGNKAQDQDPAVYVRPQEGVKATPTTMTFSKLVISTPLTRGPDLVGCDSGGRSRVTHDTEKATATLCGGQTVPADGSTVPWWSWILGMFLWYQSSVVCRDPISSFGHWTS